MFGLYFHDRPYCTSRRNCTSVPLKSDLVGVWKTIAKLNSHLIPFDVCLENFISGQVGNGTSIRFWLDSWTSTGPFCLKFPDLFKLEKYKGCFIYERCTGEGRFSQWEWQWTRTPTSPTELQQLEGLLSQISSLHLTNTEDKWHWNQDPSGVFTIKSMRHRLQNATLGPENWRFPWNKPVPIKANTMCWRLELNRLPTVDLLQKRSIPVTSSMCALCNDYVESANHLFLQCSFADSLWSILSSWCNIPATKPSNFRELFELHNDPRKKKLVNMIIQAYCWILWKMRNDHIFSNKRPSLRFAAKELKALSFNSSGYAIDPRN